MVIGHSNRCPKGVVEPPSVEILKTQLVLNSQLYLTLLWVGALDKMISKVPTQPQFFCQSLIGYNMVFIYKQELIITQVDMLK